MAMSSLWIQGGREMSYELYDFNGGLYVYKNGVYTKYRQTTLDEWTEEEIEKRNLASRKNVWMGEK